MRSELNFFMSAGLIVLTAMHAHAAPNAITIDESNMQDRSLISTTNNFTEETVNKDLTKIVQKEISDGVVRYEAKGGLAVVINARSGEVVAAVSAARSLNAIKNRLTENIENAGALRLITYANAFETGRLLPSSKIEVGRGLKIGSHDIHDFAPTKPVLTVTEAFTSSSYIASGQIAEITGPEDQRNFLTTLNQLKPLQTGAITTATPLYPQQWKTENTITIGFGHGLANSPLHAVGAVASLITGSLVTPTFMKTNDAAPKRVVSNQTSENIRSLMKANVQDGTAKVAGCAGLSIGATTATTEKIVDGHYAAGKLQTSFIAAFPIDTPQYVVLIMFDEPKTESGDISASYNAGVTGLAIIRETAKLLAVRADRS